MTPPNLMFSSIIRRRFFLLWISSAWFYAFIVAAMVTAAIRFHNFADSFTPVSPAALWFSLGVLQKSGVLLAFVVLVYLPRDLAAAGGALIVTSEMRGQPLSISGLFARVLRLLPLLIPVSVVLGSLTLLGDCLFVLPGIAVSTLGSLALPALAVCPGSVRRRFLAGVWAGAERFLAVFGINVLAGLASVIAFVLLIAGRSVVSGEQYWWIGLAVGWALFTLTSSLALTMRSAALALVLDGALRKSGKAPASQEGQGTPVSAS